MLLVPVLLRLLCRLFLRFYRVLLRLLLLLLVLLPVLLRLLLCRLLRRRHVGRITTRDGKRYSKKDEQDTSCEFHEFTVRRPVARSCEESKVNLMFILPAFALQPKNRLSGGSAHVPGAAPGLVTKVAVTPTFPRVRTRPILYSPILSPKVPLLLHGRGSRPRSGCAADTDGSEQRARLRCCRAPGLPTFCFSRSAGFLPKYFGFRSQPVFQVVTVFAAPFLVKPIGANTNYVLGQLERAFVRIPG